VEAQALNGKSIGGRRGIDWRVGKPLRKHIREMSKLPESESNPSENKGKKRRPIGTRQNRKAPEKVLGGGGEKFREKEIGSRTRAPWNATKLTIAQKKKQEKKHIPRTRDRCTGFLCYERFDRRESSERRD